MSASPLDTQEEKRKDRFLSVIYFVDASKTRSFKISIHRLKWISFCISLLLFWSLSSAYLSYDSYAEKDVLRERLHGALATIFEYQSRFDGVYESAYPKAKPTPNLDAIAMNDKAHDKVDSESSDASKARATANEDDEDSQAYDMELSDQPKIESSTGDWPIAIEDLSLHNEGTELSLSFAIRNVQSPSRSEGYIWALAVLVDSNGKKNYLVSPNGIEVDEAGNVLNVAKKANWYSIRYYKVKSFYFAIPKDLNAKIDEINIGMMDKSGSRSIFKVPLVPEKSDSENITSDSSEEVTPQPIKINTPGGKMARKILSP